MNTISRSVFTMFLFDLTVLSISTFFWALFFDYSKISILILCILTTITGLIVLYLKGNYKIREFNITVKNTYLLFEGMVLAHVVPSVYLLIFSATVKDSVFIISNILTTFAVLRLYRIFFHLYLFKVKKEKNVLILGTDERAKIIADEIQNKYALKMHIVGFVRTGKDPDEIDDCIQDNKVPVYDNPQKLKEIIEQYGIDVVVISEPDENIFQIPRDIQICKIPDFYEMVTGKYYIDDETMTDLYYHYLTHRSRVYDFCKRAYDIIAALIILIVTLPITGFTALRIWLTDHGNPLFTQTRIGIDQKEFKCYKLRTMWANDYVPKNLQKGGYAENQDVDDRVIPWCKFVRKARFDEIPQMINILKGEMSIVGPRAEWSEVVKIYKEQIPYYNCRTWIKTGWTGWAQINQGHCINNDDIAKKLQYDMYYLKHRNIVWEIMILIKAIFMALGGRHD
ncbi:MAG: sugar transferase [Candidatus Gastranaerophilales bacterium]|nr:sugar transferase [Candidatus Gastranaerophilales bacterium]